MKRIRGMPADGIEEARELRRRDTPAEDVLWEFLRDRGLSGLKFRRQHPVGPYIVDFCCPAQRLIVELDGDIHEEQREMDCVRQRRLEHAGYTVLRFSNLQVMNQTDFVLTEIVRHTGAETFE